MYSARTIYVVNYKEQKKKKWFNNTTRKMPEKTQEMGQYNSILISAKMQFFSVEKEKRGRFKIARCSEVGKVKQMVPH